MDRGLQIVPVNGYGLKKYDKLPPRDTARDQGHGRGSLVGVAPQTGGLFRPDVQWPNVKVVGQRH
jgi:hypothetical protein